MTIRLGIVIVALSLVALSGCEPAPAVGGTNLIVEAPQPGRILIADQEIFVDSVTPAVFSDLGAGPYTVTYIAGDRRVTLLDVAGPTVDFTAFIDTTDGVGADRLPVLVRPDPWARVRVRLLSNERVYSPVTTDEGLLFEVLRCTAVAATTITATTSPAAAAARCLRQASRAAALLRR